MTKIATILGLVLGLILTGCGNPDPAGTGLDADVNSNLNSNTNINSPDDGGADQCIQCPEPDLPEPVIETYEFVVSEDSSHFIPVPNWDLGMVIQSWELRSYENDVDVWLQGGCAPTLIADRAPVYAPGLPIPSLYFYPPASGSYKCRIVTMRVDQP